MTILGCISKLGGTINKQIKSSTVVSNSIDSNINDDHYSVNSNQWILNWPPTGRINGTLVMTRRGIVIGS